MSLGGFEHQLLLERAAQSNKSPIDSAFAKLTLAVSYMHHANINPPEAEKYLSSLAESDSYFAPYANMMLQIVRKEAKKIGERIPTLLNDLKRGDKEKRKWAAFKLARESGPDGVKALLQAQEDPNKYVRYEAACALARWGRDKSIKPDFNLILEALTDEDEQIREKARGAFSRQSWVEIGPDEITAIVSLMNDHYSKELFWTIRQLLSSAGLEASKAAVPKLIKLLNHEDSDVRTAVLDILRRMGPTASEAIPSLIQLLPYEDETRQDYIFAIISRMGPAAEPFMLEIAKYLDHEDINVRRAATNTLKRISPEKAEQIFKAREKAELR
jgi:HEAT repeat protein